jgi:CBS domain-containing protein
MNSIEKIKNFLLNMLSPKVSDIMSSPVITIDKDASIMEALKIMTDNEIGSLIVTHNNKPIGIFTRRDLMERVLVKNLDLNKTFIYNVMSSPLIGVKINENIVNAIKVMEKNNISRLAIFENNDLKGILTMTDIRLKFSRGYLSPQLIIKKWFVDTLAYFIFWTIISTIIQIYIVKLTWQQYIIGSTVGTIATLLFSGLYGRFLDWFRRKFNV